MLFRLRHTILIILSVMCLSTFADGPIYKFRNEHVDNDGKDSFSYGVATAISDHEVITAKHLIHKAQNEELYIHTDDGWILCDFVKEDPNDDICVLHPKVIMKSFLPVADKLPINSEAEICIMNEKKRNLEKLIVKIKNTIEAFCQNYSHGSSGAPVIKEEKIVAVANGMQTNNGTDPNGYVHLISAEKINNMLGKGEIITKPFNKIESDLQTSPLEWAKADICPNGKCPLKIKSHKVNTSTSKHWVEDEYGQGHYVSD